MDVLKGYNDSNDVYETLDTQITDLIQQSLKDNQTEGKITKIDFISPVPNTNDELVRYELALEESDQNFEPKLLLNTLEQKGFEKGLTIKNAKGESLYHDEYTADIPLRRSTQQK